MNHASASARATRRATPRADEPERRVPTYRVDDQSLLLGLYQRVLWNWLTPRIPARITPNTLTIVGQACGVLAAAACAFAVRGHTVLYLLSALLLVTSLTLDNVDGAHARRTGQCSRRGELLDHGLDGVTSTSVLVITGLLLHMNDVAMGIFGALGALTFVSVFWEQFRTGLLSIPKVGPTEGVTAVVVWQILVAVLGEPTWLQFSVERITAGTVVVIVVIAAHGVAIVPPFVRASQRAISGVEIAPLFAVVALQLDLLFHGADVIVVVATMGLLCAHTTAHFIVTRHRASPGPMLPRSIYAAAVPVCALFLWPGVNVAARAPQAAAVALVITLVGYLHTLVLGWRLLQPSGDAR